MATDQEFSFPVINDSYSSFSIDSPPLWNLSPATSPNPYYGGLIREEGQRKSFSCIEIGRLVSNEEEQEDDEGKQKMDLLWEDFNEELSSSREKVEFRTVAKRRNSNASSGALILPSKSGISNNKDRNNKPGMVVLVKVLKKLFSISSSQGKPRKRVI
ncbi:uncharacterized protein LOC129293456 [Prosopis cineraria]|uniref:uncharacterized protein LOC129293456 n=1 Tax=Prosopis cineraria TaxID=364024 RepID=UPI00240EE331|nr:uncharacterized protein LOC129293456 [Prosopis cineraria]